MAFNRVVVPSAGGHLGQKLAEFLGVDAEDELDLTEMQSKLYERLYRSGAVRHLDGTRATRRRASSRAAEKRRKARAKELRRARAQTRRAATRRTRQGV
jgi:hypothetical protein